MTFMTFFAALGIAAGAVFLIKIAEEAFYFFSANPYWYDEKESQESMPLDHKYRRMRTGAKKTFNKRQNRRNNG
ncbi:MAG: hypothetical protein NXI25_20760 [bacterium]|nr:hypothetical protein [bacterium]